MTWEQEDPGPGPENPQSVLLATAAPNSALHDYSPWRTVSTARYRDTYSTFYITPRKCFNALNRCTCTLPD